MRLLFVEGIIRFSIPLGPSGLAAVLRRGGHEVGVVEIGRDPEGALERIRRFGADAVAFSVISGTHQGYYAFARLLKERLPDVLTLWGGPHFTFYPESIELPWVDAVCLGEGEEAMAHFADAFEREGKRVPVDCPNFWVKRDGQIVRNKLRPRVRALDELPFPARDVYYERFPILKTSGVMEFLAHRGCPYKCTYCFNDGYNRLYRESAGDNRIFTHRSPESVCDEILSVREKVPFQLVTFVDDVFTLNRQWTMDFCRVYGKRVRRPFRINARFDNIDVEMMEAMVESGLRIVGFGVEAGNATIREKVMLRQMTEEKILRGAEIARKHRGRLRVITENVLASPGETFEQALETLKVNWRVRPDLGSASVFTPYPKLALTDFAIKNGYFDGDFDRLGSTFHHESILRFDSAHDQRRTQNLRSFFSLLVRHPWTWRFVKPLLSLRPNALFRWFGDLVDGYYLKSLLPYRMGLRAFLSVLIHFPTYRGASPSEDKARGTFLGGKVVPAAHSVVDR